MKKAIDLSGQTLNEWFVIGRDYSKMGRKVYWLSRCSCGNLKSVQGCNLRRGMTKNCGHSRGITHGLSNSRLNVIWRGMKYRCNNPKSVSYKDYGGRGISVCNEWLEFQNFEKWAMDNEYSDELSIDRINNDSNYEPSNCRWATIKQQNNNRRKNLIVEIFGKKQTMMQLSEETSVPYATLRARYFRGNRGDFLVRPIPNIINSKKVI